MKFAWCNRAGDFCRIVEADSQAEARKKVIAAVAELFYAGNLERAESSDYMDDSSFYPVEGSFEKWLAEARAS